MIKSEAVLEIVDYKLDSIEIEYDKSIKMIEKLESFLDKIDPSNERYCKNDRKELDYLKQNLQTLLSEKTKYNLILDYISQQEKKDRLLELYRECNKEGYFWLEIQQRIKALEEELK